MLTTKLALSFTLLLSVAAYAETADPEPDPKLTVARIFDSGELNAKSYSLRWIEDGRAYLRWEKSESDSGHDDLVRYDTAKGKSSVLVSSDHLIPPGENSPLPVDHYTWSDDASKMLIFTNSKRVWRSNTRGDYWVFDPTALALTQLGKDMPPSTMMFAEFSPKNDAVTYVHDNDLYTADLRSGKTTRLTTRESDDIINGTFDWVYEEEFRLRKGFEWSPNGQRIAYWQLDTSEVPEFTMIDNTSALYPKLIPFKYPKAGETNAAGRVGVISKKGGETTWLKIPGDPRNHYIVSIEWLDAERLLIQQFNRAQNTLRIFIADANTGKTKLLATDRDKAWIEAKDIHWIGDTGKKFVLLSERDGWQHPWLFDMVGPEEPTRLSDENFDITSWLNPAGYAMASPEDATASYLYRFDIENGGVQRITPPDQIGTHKYSIAPNGKHAVHTFSSRNAPPVTSLITLPDHAVVRVLEDNEELVNKWQTIAHTDTEYFKVNIGGDLEADAYCIKPPNFDPEKTYPLLVYVYGEPAGQTTTNSWSGKSSLWHHMLAQNGYVVMCFDNRGTPAPRGRDWRKSVYRKVGVLSSLDQAEAVRDVLKKRPYLDPERVGIWGWSGGGSNTLNALFRYPDIYKTGISIAPVANQRHYDTIYMERYMGLPSKNARGYKLGSPIHHAKNLQGNLLLIHGTADDNCHYAATETLIDELVRLRKPFEHFAYPGRSHSISEKQGTTMHLYLKMTRYLLDHLPPNDGDADLSILAPRAPKKDEKKKSGKTRAK
jgi:dipeptidyl-peptidase-4